MEPEQTTAPQKSLAAGEAYEWVEWLITTMVCVMLIFTFVGRTVGVDGESMVPTLQNGDSLVTTRLTGAPKPGDLVAVTKLTAINRPLIKRVIAVEGQTIDIDFEAGVVSIDGVPLDEPYIDEPTYEGFDMTFPQTVPEGCVFIMGDNRNNSWDSRASQLGMVDQRHILGKVVFRMFPLSENHLPQ